MSATFKVKKVKSVVVNSTKHQSFPMMGFKLEDDTLVTPKLVHLVFYLSSMFKLHDMSYKEGSSTFKAMLLDAVENNRSFSEIEKKFEECYRQQLTRK